MLPIFLPPLPVPLVPPLSLVTPSSTLKILPPMLVLLALITLPPVPPLVPLPPMLLPLVLMVGPSTKPVLYVFPVMVSSPLIANKIPLLPPLSLPVTRLVLHNVPLPQPPL